MEKKPGSGLKTKFWTPERKFALYFGIGMALLTGFMLLKKGPLWITLTAVLLGFYHLTLGLAFNKASAPFRMITQFIGNTVTVIFFSVFYYLLFTPISLLLRLAGKDVIADNSKKPAWIRFDDKENDPSRMDKLY